MRQFLWTQKIDSILLLFSLLSSECQVSVIFWQHRDILIFSLFLESFKLQVTPFRKCIRILFLMMEGMVYYPGGQDCHYPLHLFGLFGEVRRTKSHPGNRVVWRHSKEGLCLFFRSINACLQLRVYSQWQSILQGKQIWSWIKFFWDFSESTIILPLFV